MWSKWPNRLCGLCWALLNELVFMVVGFKCNSSDLLSLNIHSDIGNNVSGNKTSNLGPKPVVQWKSFESNLAQVHMQREIYVNHVKKLALLSSKMINPIFHQHQS